MASWVVIEILQRPSLYAEVQAELQQAIIIDRHSRKPKLNLQQLLVLPLLSSVYQECLRLRSSIMVVREIRNDIDIDGFKLKAGNLVMAPSFLAHQDPSVWSFPGYPAHEFWPKRFYGRKKNIDAGNYFPYGGGKATCPGRFYAKQEILTAVALLLASFDFEVLHFVNPDGSVSDRGPEVGNEARGVARIDRDLLVRMRRRT
jgi:cytochrome P450